MVPWVVLAIIIAASLLISVIYTSVVFLIDGFILVGVLWIVIGLLAVGMSQPANDSHSICSSQKLINVSFFHSIFCSGLRLHVDGRLQLLRCAEG